MPAIAAVVLEVPPPEKSRSALQTFPDVSVYAVPPAFTRMGEKVVLAGGVTVSGV